MHSTILRDHYRGRMAVGTCTIHLKLDRVDIEIDGYGLLILGKKNNLGEEMGVRAIQCKCLDCTGKTAARYLVKMPIFHHFFTPLTSKFGDGVGGAKN